MKGFKVLVSIAVDEGRVRLTYRDVPQDLRTRDPVAKNARWHLATGGGYYGMHALWQHGSVYESHAWALGMN